MWASHFFVSFNVPKNPGILRLLPTMPSEIPSNKKKSWYFQKFVPDFLQKLIQESPRKYPQKFLYGLLKKNYTRFTLKISSGIRTYSNISLAKATKFLKGLFWKLYMHWSWEISPLFFLEILKLFPQKLIRRFPRKLLLEFLWKICHRLLHKFFTFFLS